MLLATQYYRPPFPERNRWAEDLRRISETGLDAVGLWATWSWLEPEPGRFVYDDLDEIVEQAGTLELGVVMTTVSELHPYWIHRVVRGSEHVDHRGVPVNSSTLSYTHAGLAPGGCWDNPDVSTRIAAFQADIARHYADTPNLVAWDCWNEFRGPVQTDGYVCSCPHTQTSFRDWLSERYGGLDGLNAAWRRRYADWADVQVPKLPQRSWTELVDYQRFLAWRSAQHLELRSGQLRANDPNHPVMAHSVVLSPVMAGGESEYEQALSRGDDFDLATRVDAFGVSTFPNWFQGTAPEHGMRLECGRSAAGGRPFWVSELQGGGARKELGVMAPVTAATQQRWLWMGHARGAKATSFWCWRDEVFSRESSGFGLAGDDGHATERLAALQHATAVLREHGDLLDAYVPDAPSVGVLFDPSNHQLDWAANGPPATRSTGSVTGYLLALERRQIPYDVLAASRLPDLDRYRLIILPWAMVVAPEVATALERWVGEGGFLVTESELDAYDQCSLYRYPGERPFAVAMGVVGAGRRPAEPGSVLDMHWDENSYALRTATWHEPFADSAELEVLGRTADGPLAVRRKVGQGTIVALGSHVGLAYYEERYADFERFVEAVAASADALPRLRCDGADGQDVQWRTGAAGDLRLLFVTNAGPQVTVRIGPVPDDSARDLFTGVDLATDGTGTLTLTLGPDGVQVLMLRR